MGITDIFSTSFLISLAISLILAGCVFMYFNQKIAEQNHKITSMFDLVSTMAEEVNYAKQQSIMVMKHVGMPMNVPMPIQPVINQNNSPLPSFNNVGNKLIEISENDEEDDDSDDDDDDEEDSDDEEDTDEDDEEDSDGDEENNDEDNEEDDNEDESITEHKKQNINIIESELNDSDLDDESYSNLNFEEVANADDNKDRDLTTDDLKNLKTININLPTDEDIELDTDDLSDIKNIEVLDYKKLPLNKLRNVVTEKGIVTDASKLKKNDLLKLLEIE